MEGSVLLCSLALILAMAAPTDAQIRTPCSVSMLYTLAPCMSFLTTSSPNGTSPTSQCCNSLMSLTSGVMDCLCQLIVTGNVPFGIPVNRTLAISLPQVCNIPGVPVDQCKTSPSLPAPGPTSPRPSLSTPSRFTPSPSPQVFFVLPSSVTLSQVLQSNTTPLLSPLSPSVDFDTSSPASGGRFELTPSSAMPSYILPPSFWLIGLGFVVLKYY